MADCCPAGSASGSPSPARSCRDAPVLVLDEPTTGLSPADTHRLTELLGPVIAGRTVIVITHDAAVAAQADRVIPLDALQRVGRLTHAETRVDDVLVPQAGGLAGRLGAGG